MSELGERLSKLRAAKGWTMRAAAELAGISNPYLSQIESGKRTSPHAAVLRRLAKAYDVPLPELLALAGHFDDPNLLEAHGYNVTTAFDFVMADPRFRASTLIQEELTIDQKEYIVEVFERVTGAKLLGLR